MDQQALGWLIVWMIDNGGMVAIILLIVAALCFLALLTFLLLRLMEG